MIVSRLSMPGNVFLNVLMASVRCLDFNVQEEDIFEHTNGKCHLCIV